MPRLFDFDASQYTKQYAKDGFVHIPGGLNPEFYALLSSQIGAYLESTRLAEFAIGDKQQALYSFPAGADYFEQFLDAVSTVTGLDRAALVLSERHIKAYDPNANKEPLAHKDRYASEVAVGFSVNVPSGSTLVFYPYDDLAVNPFNSSAELRASLPPDRLPETLLKDVRRVEIQDQARDVQMFRGNAIWHMRARPAGTTMVYLKLNTFNCDPLGEDPRTAERSAQTKKFAQLPDAQLQQLVPLVGSRVDYLQRRYDRQWQELGAVVLWGEKAQPVDSCQFSLLELMDGRRSVADVAAGLSSRYPAATCYAAIRALAERSLIDICQSAARSNGEPSHVRKTSAR